MRKTFAVGRLTGSSTRILLVDEEDSSKSPRESMLDRARPETSKAPPASDPKTVH